MFGCHSTLWGATDITSYDLGVWGGPNSMYWDATWYTVPEAHCQLLWDSDVIPAAHSRTTLVDWCAKFVSPEFVKGMFEEKSWARWFACIGGSSSQVVGAVALTINDVGLMRRVCTQMLEVPWLTEARRRKSYTQCMQHYSPAEGYGNRNLWPDEGDY